MSFTDRVSVSGLDGWTVLLFVSITLTLPVRLVARRFARIDLVLVDILYQLGLEGSAVTLVFFLNVLGDAATGWLVGWLLYTIVFYNALARVYPESGRDILRDAQGTRAVVAIGITGFGIVLESHVIILETRVADLTGSPLPKLAMSTVVSTLAGLAFLLSGILLIRHKNACLIRNGFFRTMFNDVGKLLDYEEFTMESEGRFETILRTIDTIVVLLLLSVFLPLVALAAALLFPALELLYIVGVVALWLAPSLRVKSSVTVDIEQQLFNAVRVVKYGPKGILSLFPLALGLISTIVTCVFTVIFMLAALRSFTTDGEFLSLHEWLVCIPAFSVLMAYGWYTLWYWLRTLQRMPQFLTMWDSEFPATDVSSTNSHSRQNILLMTGSDVIQTCKSRFAIWITGLTRSMGESQHSMTENGGQQHDDPDVPTRPPGVLLQPTLMIFVFNVFVPLRFEEPSVLYIVTFFLLAASFLWWLTQGIRWTYNTAPQPVMTDNVAIAAAGGVQFTGYLLGIRLGQVELGQLYTVAKIVGNTFLSGLSVLTVFYLPDLLKLLKAEHRTLRNRGIAFGAGVPLVVLLNSVGFYSWTVAITYTTALVVLIGVVYWFVQS